MPTFTIEFNGLICHIGSKLDPAYKSHAVIIDAHDHSHRAYMKLPSGEVAITDGDVIEFDLGHSRAHVAQSFQDRVPSLEPLSLNGDVLPDVATAKHRSNDQVLAYVLFPSGTLSGSGFMEHELEFVLPQSGDKKKMCVARKVELTTTSSGPVTMTVTNGKKTRHELLPANATIEIWNIEDPPSTHGHFKLYRRLIQADDFATVSQGSEKCVDRQSRSAVTAFPDPECTNSGWP